MASPTGTRPNPGRRRAASSRPSAWRRMSANRAVYLFILPGFLWYVVFHYLPILGNVIAFKDYSVFICIRDSPWVGLDNVTQIVDPAFLTALKNTRIIEVLLLFAFPAPLALQMAIVVATMPILIVYPFLHTRGVLTGAIKG